MLNTLACAVLLASGSLALAQPSWENLNRLKPGDEVRVVKTDMKTVEGAFERVTPDGITVAGASVERSRVFRVTVARKSRRIRNALVGAAIGAGVGLGGAGLLLAATGGSDDTNGIVIRGLATGAIISGTVGAAIPPGQTVYRADWNTKP